MKWMKKLGSDVVLLGILLLAAFLYGYGIWNDQYANTYYTTAVGSMLQSFHNFFFASLDSAGSVTVDKPPVTFWIQTLSALIFGLHGWSVILPQVLAGVGSVLLVYLLVKPTFGRTAARLAALAMSTTPVAAAVSRTNNIDAMLVFTLLLAAWFLFKGTQRNQTGSLLAAFALIGVGFNEKMLQAYMVLPAFYLFYVLAAKVNWKKKTGVLAACTAVLLVVSLSWAVIVDSIPASKRPYMGSSGTNSVLNLAFGYNGVSRLTGDRSTGGSGGGFPGGGGGMFGEGEMPFWNGREMPGMNGAGGQDGQGGPGMMNGTDGQGTAAGGQSNTDGGQPQQGQAPGGTGGSDGRGQASDGGGMQGQAPGGRMDDGGRQGGAQFDGGQAGRGGMNGGGMFNTGTAGPLRLFQSALSGQASWLLPFLLFGCVGIFASLRRRNFTQKHKEALFWLAWLVPAMGFFSIAGFFHQYYLIMMAPPIAALVGAGWLQLWTCYKERATWLSWLLPVATLATAVFQWYIIHPYDNTIGRGWSIGVLAGGIAVTVLMLALRIFKGQKKRFVHASAVLGLLVLLAGPLYWALTPITYGSNSMTPAAGPDSSSGFGGGMGMNGRNGATGVNEDLLAYLKEHNTGEKYLFAAMDYGTAGPYIIDEHEPVVILNGFNNSDVPYTTDTLKALVASGKVKYFLVTTGGMGGGGRGGNSEITNWITENGTAVPAADWQGTVTGSNGGTLYEVTVQ
ncbi:Undecaprenyl phosphate-alpha-4-amino-4-deoxy-L-arabinose arabinosyl transferase [compost metagenome]